MLYYNYLPKTVLRGFDNYRYSCLDTSPLSNYVMHPFWNQVVKLCPIWIAPNLLTFIGFLCCVSHFLVSSIFDYDFTASLVGSSHPIPSWAWFCMSFLLFMSHTLDGIDGKQARRTQTSSPLGELFDHGCDSWSTVFITTVFYSVFGNNADEYSIPIMRMYAILWSVFFSFHMSHWEKYNTGVMYLPWSYDIAMLVGTILYFLTGTFGYETWKFKLQNGQSAGIAFEIVFYLCVYGLSFPIALKNMWAAYSKGENKQNSFFEAMRPMVSFSVALVLCFFWTTCSKNEILRLDARCFFLMSGTIYANMSCRLIVAQMSHTRCELLNYLLLPLAIAAMLATFFTLTPASELAILYILTIFTILTHLHYVICVVLQMCDYLKIDCFSIRTFGESRLIPATDHEEEVSLQIDSDE